MVDSQAKTIKPFQIGVSDEVDEDGFPLGIIQIGESTERFTLLSGYWSPEDYLRHWCDALGRLVQGAPAVALVTRMSSPDENGIRQAWVLFRCGQDVYVQERLFVPDEPVRFDEDEHLVNLEPRQTIGEEGERISEWVTNVAAIQSFLATGRQQD